MNHARVFKKTAPNGKLTVYVEKRELIIKEGGIEPLQGVLFVEPNYVKEKKVFGQFVLTFRYGREDEEVMGLRFCNEACLVAAQLWPEVVGASSRQQLTPLQETLVKRLGNGATAFFFNISFLAPPSVTLLPARTYMGAPIGTNYDIRIFIGDNPEDKPHKRSSIRMGIKLTQVSTFIPALKPYAAFSRQLLLTDGQVSVEATLNKEIFQRAEPIIVSVTITNNSSRNVKKIKILGIQFVDVAMFSNGKFKNVVAFLESTEGCPVSPGNTMTKNFELIPARGVIKNWIALEEFYDKESTLASSVLKPSDDERNVFAIYVSYYVKVKLVTSALGGEVCVKVPFKVMKIQTSTNSQESKSTPGASIVEKRLPCGQGSPVSTSRSMCDLRTLTNNSVKLKKIPRKHHPPSRSASEDTAKHRSKSQPTIVIDNLLKDNLLRKRISVEVEPVQCIPKSTNKSDYKNSKTRYNNRNGQQFKNNNEIQRLPCDTKSGFTQSISCDKKTNKTELSDANNVIIIRDERVTKSED